MNVLLQVVEEIDLSIPETGSFAQVGWIDDPVVL